MPMDKWLAFVKETGFDGWEEASWELDLNRCATDATAEAYARERVDMAKKHGLEIFTVAGHLQGQALGDEPSAKTLQFVSGEPVAAYKAWRDKGNKPPRTNPYYVPDEVGRLIHDKAAKDLLSIVRFAHYLGKLQNRKVAVPAFVGSPAHCWSHFFLFPPLPSSIAGHAIPDVREVSLELLAERFGPVFDACKKYGVTFDLECHPSERAMGDIESATDYLAAMDRAGYADVVGFNLDGSHMEWQGVSVVQFIREFGDRIHCAHIKGVQVIREHYPRRPAGRPSPDGSQTQRLELRHGRLCPRRQQRRGDHDRAEPSRFRRRRQHRMGRQRRRAARRRQGRLALRAQGRPAAKRHAPRRDAEGLETMKATNIERRGYSGWLACSQD